MPREVAHLVAEVTRLGGHCDAQLATTCVLACVPHSTAFTPSNDATQLWVHDGGDTAAFARRRCFSVADVVDTDAQSQTPDCLTSSAVASDARSWLHQGFNATVLSVCPSGVSDTLWGDAQSPLGPYLVTALFQLYGPMHVSCWLVCPGGTQGGHRMADCLTLEAGVGGQSSSAYPQPPTRVLVTTIDELHRCTALIGHHSRASGAAGGTCSAVFARAVPKAGGPALTLALLPGPSTPTVPHLAASTWRSAWLTLCKLLTSPRPGPVPSFLSLPLEACLATFLGVASNARTFIVADVAAADVGAACRLLAVTCPGAHSSPGAAAAGPRTPVAGRVHADVPCVRATTPDFQLRQAGASSLWCDHGAVVRWSALEAQVWAPAWQQRRQDAAPAVPRARPVQLGVGVATRRAPSSAWHAPQQLPATHVVAPASMEAPAVDDYDASAPLDTGHADARDTGDEVDSRLSFGSLFARLAPEGALDAPYDAHTPTPAAWAATSARVARDAALDAVEMSQRGPAFDAIDAGVLTSAAAAAAPRRRPSRPWHVLSRDQAALEEAERRVDEAEEKATQSRAETARLAAELAVAAAQRDRWRHLASSAVPVPVGVDDAAETPHVSPMVATPTAQQAAALAAASRRAHAAALRRLAAAQTTGEAAVRRAASADAAVAALTAALELSEQRLQAERATSGRLRGQVSSLEDQVVAARAQLVDAEAARAAADRSAALFREPDAIPDAGLLVAQARQATLDAVLVDLQHRLGRPVSN